MLNAKSLFAFAVLVPLLGAAIPAEAAKATKSNSTAARAECFRQANEAVAAQGVGAKIDDKERHGTGCLSPVLLQSRHSTIRTANKKIAFGRSFYALD
jgi:hypothetical protein